MLNKLFDKNTYINLYLQLSIFTTYSFWVVIWTLLQAAILQFFWNQAIPDIIPLLNIITYKQSFILLIVMRLLTRSWTLDTIKETGGNLIFQLMDLKQGLHKLYIVTLTKMQLDEARYSDFINDSEPEETVENDEISNNNTTL